MKPEDRERAIVTLRAIKSETARLGFPPTKAEIGEALGLAEHSAVTRRIESLRRYGFVEDERGSPRSVRVTPAGERFLAEDSENTL